MLRYVKLTLRRLSGSRGCFALCFKLEMRRLLSLDCRREVRSPVPL
jgi:hypothetical protein